MEETQGTFGDGYMDLVMKACMSHFAVLDLVQISCSNKALGQLCQSQLSEGNKQLAHTLLQQLVQEAAQLNTTGLSFKEDFARHAEVLGKCQKQYRKALTWLIKKSGITLRDRTHPQLADTAKTLMSMPFIPRPLCEVLVESGFQPEYKQLVAAARHGVCGLTVWSEAVDAAEVPSSLPVYLQRLVNYPGLLCTTSQEVGMHTLHLVRGLDPSLAKETGLVCSLVCKQGYRYT